MTASSSRITRTSADCRATCSLAARSSVPWPPRLSWISPAARARSASMNSSSPNSALTAPTAASTSRSSSSSPASIAARKTVPPASISRSTIAMSDRTSSACWSCADRTSFTLRLISRWTSPRDGSSAGWADRTRSSASARTALRALAPDRGQDPHPGHGHGAAQVGGLGQRRPERGRAQQRQHRRSRDVAQLVAAVPGRAQQPLADPRLEPHDLLEVAQSLHPHVPIAPPRRRQPSRRHGCAAATFA